MKASIREAIDAAFRAALIAAYIEGWNESRDSRRSLWTVEECRTRQENAERCADDYMKEAERG